MQSNEYKLWFDKAEDNLLWAKHSLKNDFNPLVCFLSHQAVELALKGYLYLKEVVPEKTHNLVNLSEVCLKQGLSLKEEEIKQLNILTDYYFESRYPDMFDEKLNSKTVAEEALAFARKIVDEVKSQLPL